MTKSELFPRHIYRVRKRTMFELPGKAAALTIELYFETSDTYLRGQRIGEYTKAASQDGTVCLAIAKVVSPEGDITYYLETAGDAFEEVSKETAMARTYAFEKEFQEKYEIIVRDPETDTLISDMLASARWEPL